MIIDNYGKNYVLKKPRYVFEFDDDCLISKYRVNIYDDNEFITNIPFDSDKQYKTFVNLFEACKDICIKDIHDGKLMVLSGKVLLVDGYNIFTRAYKSFSFYDDKGQNEHSIYGFFTYLKRAWFSLRYDKVYIVFDGGGHSAFRESINKDYKSDRKKVDTFDIFKENEKNDNFELLLKTLDDMNIVYFRYENIEADDIIYYITQCLKSDNIIYIYSNDSDFYQLIDENVFVVRPIKGGVFETIDRNIYKQRFNNVDPANSNLIKSIFGDKTDNINGTTEDKKVRKKIIKILSKKPPLSFDNFISLLNDKNVSIDVDKAKMNYNLLELSKGNLSQIVRLKIDNLIANSIFKPINNRHINNMLFKYKIHIGILSGRIPIKAVNTF